MCPRELHETGRTGQQPTLLTRPQLHAVLDTLGCALYVMPSRVLPDLAVGSAILRRSDEVPEDVSATVDQRRQIDEKQRREPCGSFAAGRILPQVVVWWLAVVVSFPALAQNDSGESSADAVAKALANPNAVLGFLSFPIDYVAYEGELAGAGSESAWKLNFQPSLPYPLGEGTNLFVRPLIPLVLDQPVPLVGDVPVVPLPGMSSFESRSLELADISFDVAIGKTLPSKIVLFGGIVGTLPTATDDALSLDQYLLGPEFYIGKVLGWGSFGVLLTHQWNVAGDDSFDTSLTGGQYFFTYNLRNAWQIQMTPTFSYNHEAESGQGLTFPLGVGVSKTTLFGETPWKFNLQYWNFVEKPDAFGPDFQIRFTVTPVIPLPW